MNKIDPRERPDLSRFLVHFTRDSEDGLSTAEENLVSILKIRTIEARNPHCLFHPLFGRLRFSDVLKKKFNSVCLTETPLHFIEKLVNPDLDRGIPLQPYGLVFWKENLIKRGANPAIYVNAYEGHLREYLLSKFKEMFHNCSKYKTLCDLEKEFSAEIIQFYGLINIMGERYDCHWEREWRFFGDLTFKSREVVAIFSPKPDDFRGKLRNELPRNRWNLVKKIPIISPEWDYEKIIEELSCYIWDSFD